MRTVDFAYHTEAAREAINRWVSRQTGGKIPHLLARGDIDDLTAFVLADAVYLDAKWLAPFRKQDTRQAPFHTPQGTVTVPTMHQTGYFPYHRGPGYQALEMPYRGRRLAFDILLPDPGQLQPLLHRIAAVGPLKLLGGLSPLTKVSLALPRLNLRTSLYLDAALKTLGMPLAFTPGAADLSGIALQPGRMYIKHVVHQSYLRVYEGGTVAAAATGVIGELEAAMATIPFDVNRPFVFVIRDVKTGAIVFLGTVSRP
jgi:serpin B